MLPCSDIDENRSHQIFSVFNIAVLVYGVVEVRGEYRPALWQDSLNRANRGSYPHAHFYH